MKNEASSPRSSVSDATVNSPVTEVQQIQDVSRSPAFAILYEEKVEVQGQDERESDLRRSFVEKEQERQNEKKKKGGFFCGLCSVIISFFLDIEFSKNHYSFVAYL